MTPLLSIYSRFSGADGELGREAERVVYGLGRRDPIDLPPPLLVYNHDRVMKKGFKNLKVILEV
jgi:hypothetical protein